MALVVHCYNMGVPYRLKCFCKIFESIRDTPDVQFWTGGQILDWCLKVGPEAPSLLFYGAFAGSTLNCWLGVEREIVCSSSVISAGTFANSGVLR